MEEDGSGRKPRTWQLPGPEIRVYTSVVYSHGIRYIYLGLTIMRLVANGMDTHTCRRATKRKMARRVAPLDYGARFPCIRPVADRELLWMELML